MPEYLGIALNLQNLAASQYAGWNFNSFCKLGDNYLGANENGIFILGSGDNDNGQEIRAFFELVLSDFGISNQKRLRSAFIGYESDGQLTLTVKNDEGNERTYYLAPPGDVSQRQGGSKVSLGRDGKGRYWSFRVENLNGCDFSVDHIEVIPIILGKKPSGS